LLRRLQREHAHLAAELTNAPAAWMNARITADSAVASLLGIGQRSSNRNIGRGSVYGIDDGRYEALMAGY
jgi:hypothetical protein